MYFNIHIPLFELVLCLAETVDLISQDLADHHKRVAYISFSIAREMGLTIEEQNNLVLAGLLHDSGGLSVKERLEALLFEAERPYQHAELGYRLYNKFKPLSSEDIEKAGGVNLPEQIIRGGSRIPFGNIFGNGKTNLKCKV